MVVHSIRLTPVKKKNGGYKLKRIEQDEVVLPERETRESPLCKVCEIGDNGNYPECCKMCGID